MWEALVPNALLLLVLVGMRAFDNNLAGLRRPHEWIAEKPVHAVTAISAVLALIIGLATLGYQARTVTTHADGQSVVNTGLDSYIYWILALVVLAAGVAAVVGFRKLSRSVAVSPAPLSVTANWGMSNFVALRDQTSPLSAGIEALRPIVQTGGWWLVRARVTNDEDDERGFTAQTDSIDGETEDAPWPSIWQQNKRRDIDIPGESSATLKLYEMRLFPYSHDRFVLIPFDEGDQRCNAINVPGHQTCVVLRATSRGVSKTATFLCGVDAENVPYFRRPREELAAVRPQPFALVRLQELRMDFHLLEANAPVRFGDLPTPDWLSKYENWVQKVHAAIPEGRKDLHDAFTAPPPPLGNTDLLASDRPSDLRRVLDQRKLNLDGVIAHLSSQLGLSQ